MEPFLACTVHKQWISEGPEEAKREKEKKRYHSLSTLVSILNNCALSALKSVPQANQLPRPHQGRVKRRLRLSLG